MTETTEIANTPTASQETNTGVLHATPEMPLTDFAQETIAKLNDLKGSTASVTQSLISKAESAAVTGGSTAV